MSQLLVIRRMRRHRSARLARCMGMEWMVMREDERGSVISSSLCEGDYELRILPLERKTYATVHSDPRRTEFSCASRSPDCRVESGRAESSSCARKLRKRIRSCQHEKHVPSPQPKCRRIKLNSHTNIVRYRNQWNAKCPSIPQE